jgi:hypothetical protein
MIVIVAHKKSKQRYVLVGTGFGTCPSMKPSPMFGTLLPDGGNDEAKMVAVCENSGMIRWIQSKEVEVVEINGHTPGELIKQ